MEISLISPAAAQSSNGNYTTAARWKRILQSLGHQVDLQQSYHDEYCDLMIALHAWRSADAIHRFKSLFPNKPLIVALTGTDVYRFIHSHPKTTLSSIKLADHLIGLHEKIANTIPTEQQHKLSVIYQASTLKPIREIKHKSDFAVCVAGHLREEKDSLRPAYAVRSLPSTSNIFISHFGKAHNKEWEYLARKESVSNKRYHWHGEITQSLLRIKFSHSRLLILPSRMEGGANIISEAIMCNLPVLASSIEGSIGLLGEDYLGYFEVENTNQLKELLLRCECDEVFYRALQMQCQSRRQLFSHLKEVHSWKQLLETVGTFKQNICV